MMKLTLHQLYKSAVKTLDIENADFEVRVLIEHVFAFNYTKFILNKNMPADEKKKKQLMSMIDRRKQGEPLQYIIGEWDFIDTTFKVGKDVLIPRPETALLVDAGARHLQNNREGIVFDLCAGSGCIGLSIAQRFPESRVYLLEKMPGALKWLRKNAEEFNLKNIFILKADIFSGFMSMDLPEPDIILSNPPYIPSAELISLQKEVLFEPACALDGGKDGLDFYRCISSLWLPFIKSGGLAAAECGQGQASDIAEIFALNNPIKTDILKDFADIDRVVAVKF